MFDYASLFAYELDPGGRPVPAPGFEKLAARFLEAARNEGLQAWATVVNDVRHADGSVRLKSAETVHTIVSDPGRRADHARALAERIERDGFEGLHLDYERVPERDAEAYRAFVSRLGADAMAAVGLTESLMTIVYAIGMGLATGTTAIISRRIGEKRNDLAAVSAVQAIIAGVVVSLIIAIPSSIFAGDILRLMGAGESLVKEGGVYASIILGANGIIMLLFINNAIFRSAGDAAISMRVLFLANILNIILDPCLIFGLGPFPELGIKGAAIATTTGRGLAVAYQFYVLFNGSSRIAIAWKAVKLEFSIMMKLFRLSMGGIGQSLIATTSWIGLVRIIAEFGSNSLAGYTIGIRIIVFALLPAWGISNAASTLVGQNLGANRPERAEKAVWMTGMFNSLVLGIISLFLIINPGFFIGFFTDEADVIRSAVLCLRIVSYGYIFYALGMVVIQSLNGSGDTVTPTVINFFCFWILEIPLAYFLAIHAGFAEKGVYISIFIAESLMTLSALVIFRKGKWKLQKV